MAITIKTTLLALTLGAVAHVAVLAQTVTAPPARTSTAMPTPAQLQSPEPAPGVADSTSAASTSAAATSASGSSANGSSAAAAAMAASTAPASMPPPHAPQTATATATSSPNAADLLKGPLADHSPGVYTAPLSHSVAEADAKLVEVAAGRAAVASEYAASETICYNKFFVTICLDKAKEKRRVALAGLRAIEVEANHFKREEEVRRRDAELAERVRKDAEDAAQRTAAPVKAPYTPPPPVKPASGPSVAERKAEHDAKVQRQQADDAAKAGLRAANAAGFEKKKAETAKHVADVAAKKAAKDADLKKKADAAAAAAAASAAAAAAASAPPKQ